MSRIEEALERAAQMQKQSEAAKAYQPQEKARSAPAATGALEPGEASRPGPAPDGKVYGPVSGNGWISPEGAVPGIHNPMLVTVSDPISPVAEEYRKLKENLVKKTKKNGFRNTIMVTSSAVSEGKSLTATNLAISLAQEFDHTVLLVDADLRRPTIHRLLGIEPEIGLSDCLVEGREVSDAFIRTGIGRLVFLPAGKPMPNPGELFSSTMMRNLILEMKHRYSDRYVIIDTPPVLPFAETRSLSHSVDGALVVVKEGEVSLKDVEETVEALRETDILGFVYNQASKPLNAKHHYYYYHYRD